MEFNYFDLVVAIIILLLGLKGIVNGLFKEVFGLLGIIGGIFIASRVGDRVGEYLNSLIFNFSSPAAVNFLGFLTTFAGFWILMILIGYIFKKLNSISGLGPIDKILGFVFGAGKFFLITSVIVHATYNIKTIKSAIDPSLDNSILFPIMVKTGEFIMKIDPVGLNKDINETIDKETKIIKSTAQELISKSSMQKIEEIKQKLKEN